MYHYKSYEELIKELHHVADYLTPFLSASEILGFRDFIDSSEVGIGLEMLMLQIVESEVFLPEEIYSILKNAAQEINLDSLYIRAVDDNQKCILNKKCGSVDSGNSLLN